MRPFFPPLEPLQSVNLRAALFRSLSELKKSGALGREAILRKTMLDDCKGERFEEVLAMFSAAVLRKVCSETKNAVDTPVTRLSMNREPTATEQEELLPLVLAHRASLASAIHEKSHFKSRSDSFRHFLQTKRDELSTRSQDGPQLPSDNADHADIGDSIRKVWYGNEDWANTILEGGSQIRQDCVLEMPFSTAWPLVKQNKLQDLGNMSAPDLLVDLEIRLFQQKARLNKWRDFKNTLHKEQPRGVTAEQTKNSSGALEFREHQKLTTSAISDLSRDVNSEHVPSEEYASLAADFENSLAQRKTPNHDTKPSRKDHRILKDFESADSSTKPQDSNAGSTRSSATTKTQVFPNHYEYGGDFASEEPQDPVLNYDDKFLKPTNETSRHTDTEGRALSQPDVESSGPGSITLVERTRQSMSFLPPPSSQPRRSTAEKPRQSQVFPVNQFETPKRSQNERRSGASTPQEELFNHEADYASVFKSRPRIAVSPINSPSIHMTPLDDIESEAEYSIDMDQGESVFQHSPLARPRLSARKS